MINNKNKNKMFKDLDFGIGVFILLGLVLIVLKLFKIISWSWWIVTGPLWGPVAAILMIWLIINLNELFNRKT